MQIYPVSNINNQISYKGILDRKTADLIKNMSDRWLDKAGTMKTVQLTNTCLFASERINNVYLNLSAMMERFGHGCKLMYAKSEKTGKHRFYIENKYSNYRLMCGDTEFSPNQNKIDDICKLEVLENNLAKKNPYEENSHFILQRKSESKKPIFDGEFVPDSNFVFLEDRLVGKEAREQASMEDIKEFLEAAKEEGLIDG